MFIKDASEPMADRDHPFLRPLWRRIVLVAGCVAWAVIEYVNGAQGWAALAGGMAVLGAWQFLIAYPKPPADGG